MIPKTSAAPQPESWQRSLRDAFRNAGDLLAFLRLDAAAFAGSEAAARQFPCRVPRAYAGRMRPGDAEDPLLRQVLPQRAELDAVPGFVSDPLEESRFLPVPGLVRKYHGRALLNLTGACAVHCRYCFRRHFDYAADSAQRDGATAAVARIARCREISEVILSGGDPLSLADERLAGVLAALSAIPHVRRIRVHTRLPVVIPSRVTDAFLALPGRFAGFSVMVLHINHAREVDAELAGACAALRASGLTLLNQAVLLRGVNDTALALSELSETLFAADILPYYLHQLDPVAGAAHFAVPDARAQALAAGLAARLPGYLVPRLVREVPGAPGKTVLPPGA